MTLLLIGPGNASDSLPGRVDRTPRSSDAGDEGKRASAGPGDGDLVQWELFSAGAGAHRPELDGRAGRLAWSNAAVEATRPVNRKREKT
jgi:hypothetical protein